MATVAIEHIELDARGVARILGTSMKVSQLVLEKQTNGWSPEELRSQHFNSLSLAQIHAAFSYYYDHQADVDRQIKDEFEAVERMRLTAPETAGRKKLRELGHLS